MTARLRVVLPALLISVFINACAPEEAPETLVFGAFTDRQVAAGSYCEPIDEPDWWDDWMNEQGLEGRSGVFADNRGTGSTHSQCLGVYDPFALKGSDGRPGGVQESLERTWIMSALAESHHPCPDDDLNAPLVFAPTPDRDEERVTLDDGAVYRLLPDVLRYGTTTGCFIETGIWIGPEGGSGSYVRSWDLVQYRIELTPEGEP